MIHPPLRVVDMLFDPKWEGLDYHRFFWDRCQSLVVLQAIRIENGIFEFPGPVMFEYHSAKHVLESEAAFNMLSIWRYRRQWGEKVRYHFADANEAMMFKLTFGGA